MTVTHTTRTASIDEIAAEMDRRGAVIEKLEAKLRLVDQDRIHRGKMLKRIRDMLVNPRDHLDDAGDLVSFGSTNDADTFRDAVQMLEDWRWDDIMREGKLPDLVANCRKANERADQSNARVALLESALKPFAEEAENWHDDVPDDYRSLCTEPGSETVHPGSETAFTVGDIRRARALLPPKEAR